MRFAVPSWAAVARLDEPSPVLVPAAAVVHGSKGCGAHHPAPDQQHWVCTRRRFHGGRHAAALRITGEVLAVWP